MRAKVNQNYRWGIVRAFGGHEYVKYEWRRVPAGLDDEAARLKAAGLLDLQHDELPEVHVVDVPPLEITAAAADLAAQHSLNLAGMTGTGTGGRIIKADILALLAEEEE